jgi:G3E family GTPase
MLIQGVQHVVHPPLLLDAWPSDDRRTRIVFITRNIEDSVLRDSLRAFDEAVARVERARALDGRA